MPKSPREVFLEQRMTEVFSFDEVAGGSAVVFSMPAPEEKDRQNQDGAALIQLGDEAAVLVVADGAGGLPAGARAAALAINTMHDVLRAEGEDPVRTRILDGFERANQAVLDLGLGAGTTLAVVEIQEQVVRPYHVGDSSILVVGQRGKRKLLTVSHGPVGYQVEAGVLDHTDALHHEDLAVVTNLVGNADMRIEVGAPLELAPFDTVVIGSDGLFDNLHLEEITEAVRSGPIEEAAMALVSLSLERMTNPKEGKPSKPDDLTFVIYRRSGKK